MYTVLFFIFSVISFWTVGNWAIVFFRWAYERIVYPERSKAKRDAVRHHRLNPDHLFLSSRDPEDRLIAAACSKCRLIWLGDEHFQDLVVATFIRSE